MFAAGEPTKVVAKIKYKMRLRLPILESQKYFRNTAEIENMVRAAELNNGTLAPLKKQITIQIAKANNLQFAYSNVTDVAPFFYYQFYTYEERYSKNSTGVNPIFNDRHSYEVTCDARAQDYFERENLEIILFDDNAPVTGANEATAGDDMIGVVTVPLKDINRDCNTQNLYPVKNQTTGA